MEPPNLDLQNKRYKFYKTAFKSEIFELAFNPVSLTAGTHRSAGPMCQRKKIEEAARGGAEPVELTDSGVSGDGTGTTVFPKVSRIN